MALSFSLPLPLWFLLFHTWRGSCIDFINPPPFLPLPLPPLRKQKRGNKPSQLICLFNMCTNLFSTLSLSFQAQPAVLWFGSFFISLYSPSSLLSRFLLYPTFLCPRFLSFRSITLSFSCLLISIVTLSLALLSPPFSSPFPSLVPHFPPCLVQHLDRSMYPSQSAAPQSYLCAD